MRPFPLSDSLPEKLKLLMFVRVVFTSLLLGSTVLFQLSEQPSVFDPSLVVLYLLIIAIFAVSCFYAIALNRWMADLDFAVLQIVVDTVIVSMIVFVTGGISSVFSFLYLVVIIYSSLLVPRVIVFLIGAFSGIEYGLLVFLEFTGAIHPFAMSGMPRIEAGGWEHMAYKVVMIGIACIAVAVLSAVLAEQTDKTQKKLKTLEDHVKRVEKLASMGEMAAGMAHEIKNPLASLAGSIQLLKEDIPPNPYHEKLMQIILRETDRLSELINNFLMFARPPAGKQVMVLLGEAVTEVISLFDKDPRRSRNVTVHSNLDGTIWVRFDPVQLRQVLWNLLLNAAEAIEKKGEIRIRLSQAKTNTAVLDITDTGSGMSRDTIAQIFDPFFTTKPRGTGLGLSLVYRILESNRCRIDVDSQIGRGTTIALTFPTVSPDSGPIEPLTEDPVSRGGRR